MLIVFATLAALLIVCRFGVVDSRRRRLTLFLSGTLVALLITILPLIPLFPGHAVYEGVGTARGESLIGPRGGSKQFLIRKGKLYLLTERNWRALLINTRIEPVKWSDTDLQRLRNMFPEFVDGTW
jgi:hypothetical protein